MPPSSSKIVASNRKALHNFFVLQRFEAGIVLRGAEVKSVRLSAVNLSDSFCFFKNSELFVRGIHISPYDKANIFNSDPLRVRKLLLHKREILRLQAQLARDGLSLIPLSIYFNHSLVKLEIALCKGKKLFDKRQSDADKSAQRLIQRSLKDAAHS